MPWWLYAARGLLVALGLFVGYAYLLRLVQRVVARLPLSAPPRWGALWPVVSAGKALLRPPIAPRGVHSWAYWVGPLLAVGALWGALALLPLGSDHAGQDAWTLGGYLPSSSLWWILGLLGLSTLGGALGALGIGFFEPSLAVRGLAYLAPGCGAAAGVALLAGSLHLPGIVRAQDSGMVWIVYQPLGAAVFFVSLLIAGRLQPFRPLEVENEAQWDFQLLHAGSVPALYHLAEYFYLLVTSALGVQLYLGGWSGIGADGWWWLVSKTLVVLLLLLWLRQQLPLRRWAMPPAWRLLTALALANLLVTALLLRYG